MSHWKEKLQLSHAFDACYLENCASTICIWQLPSTVGCQENSSPILKPSSSFGGCHYRGHWLKVGSVEKSFYRSMYAHTESNRYEHKEMGRDRELFISSSCMVYIVQWTSCSLHFFPILRSPFIDGTKTCRAIRILVPLIVYHPPPLHTQASDACTHDLRTLPLGESLTLCMPH
jgi:hypothetical protein